MLMSLILENGKRMTAGLGRSHVDRMEVAGLIEVKVELLEGPVLREVVYEEFFVVFKVRC